MPPGHYSTDLGYSLESLARDHLDTLDSRTTFIMVGDARNNYNDPRLDIFQQHGAPQPPHHLDQPGAAHALGSAATATCSKYAPLCDNVVVAATLGELTDAIDDLMH